MGYKMGCPNNGVQINGDIKNVANYWTIMVSSIVTKLFGGIMESKISEWVEKGGKRTYG